jgi:hydrogenase maturation protease
MSCILIIGYGNPLRGDDAFGWLLAERLKDKFHDCDMEILAAHQLTPELAQPISRARYVIFADASMKSDACGVTVTKLRESSDEDSSFSHRHSPESLLSMARILYGTAPRAAFLLTAQAYQMAYGEQVSPEMAVELDKAVERIAALCEFLSPQLFSRASVLQNI